MPLCHRRQHPLPAPVLLHSPSDLAHRSPGAILIALVHDNNIRQVEHDNFLELQARTVVGVHNEHGLVDQFVLKGHRFLAGADRLDNHVIEAALGQELKAIFRRGRQTAGLPARRHAAHENAIVLRIDHGSAIAEQRARSDNARVVRENRYPCFWFALEQPQPTQPKRHFAPTQPADASAIAVLPPALNGLIDKAVTAVVTLSGG